MTDVLLPYWPGGRCDLDAPLAEDAAWIVYDNETDRNPVDSGQYAEKIVGSVVISARFVAGSVSGKQFGQAPQVRPAGSWHPNALSVIQQRNRNGNAIAEMEFSITVAQPEVRIQAIDLDNNNNETLRFAPGIHYPKREADLNVATKIGVSGSPAGIRYWAAANTLDPQPNPPGGANWNGSQLGFGYVSNGRASETSALLLWRNTPWTPTQPIRTAYVLQRDFFAAGNNRASQYDFWGPIFQEACTLLPRFARLVCCGGVMEWVDTEDGHTLTQAELETMERRN